MHGSGVDRGIDAPLTDQSPRTWSTVSEAYHVVSARGHLRRTIGIALVVGTVLFAINQLDVVLDGRASATTYLKGALTYLVPFCVANYGVLVATHLRRSR